MSKLSLVFEFEMEDDKNVAISSKFLDLPNYGTEEPTPEEQAEFISLVMAAMGLETMVEKGTYGKWMQDPDNTKLVSGLFLERFIPEGFSDETTSEQPN